MIWRKNWKFSFNSIHFDSIKQHVNLIELKWIKFSKLFVFDSAIGVRLGYTEGVEGQSIFKLIVARFLRKLGNSIYQRWGDGQTVAARGQTFKGGLILHVKSKGFRFCLFSYIMMQNNWRLLFDHKNISKTVHLKHKEIVF